MVGLMGIYMLKERHNITRGVYVCVRERLRHVESIRLSNFVFTCMIRWLSNISSFSSTSHIACLLKYFAAWAKCRCCRTFVCSVICCFDNVEQYQWFVFQITSLSVLSRSSSRSFRNVWH